MRPMGRQCASGLSLLFSDLRLFNRSAAQGLSGSRPSLNPAPMLKKVAAGGPSDAGAGGGGGGGAPSTGGTGGGPPRPARPMLPRLFSQIPERSGCPSAVLGAGPSSFGFPSGVL